MRHEDSVLIEMTEEEIRAKPDSEKLTILLSVTLPLLKTLYGKNGIKDKVERHDIHLKYIWGLLIIVVTGILAAVWKGIR